MELADTAKMMTSSDYKERFKAEYNQVKIRHEKLHEMNVKYEEGTLDFEPKCSLELLKHQEKVMKDYILTLEIRAKSEGIEV